MILIEDIEYYQVISGELEYKGKARIRQELIRPFLQFENSKGEVIEFWNCEFQRTDFLKAGPYQEYFSHDHLSYISKKFNLLFKRKNENSQIYKSYILANNSKYLAEYIYIEHNNISYLMLFYRRWQFSNQPRSAGEDAMGEDITYIHGIWENPELPESIIKKIKS